MPTSMVPLQLPHGRRLIIGGDPRDRSIVAPLRDSDGDWEPHLRGLFERFVQPDWTCLDVGANIGAHTLALATLATTGQVIAFEPGPANAAHLTDNAARLEPPHGPIEIVAAALSNQNGPASFLERDELAGCSYLTLPQTMADTDGHARVVEAVRLDDWLHDRPLARLDLVKLDVEGSETLALAGAQKTLFRYRPLLVTEYNPAAAQQIAGEPADGYFRLLERLYPTLALIEPDSSLTPLDGWATLERRLADGKGWEDLLCSHDGVHSEPGRRV